MQRPIKLCSERAFTLSKHLEKEINSLIAQKFALNLNLSLLFAPLGSKKLGECRPTASLIIVNEILLDTANYETIKSIALHEAAHAVQFRKTNGSAHDDAFRAICATLGVEDGYEKAKVDIKQKTSTLEKIKKLEALGSSPFTAEAQEALKKARSLMAKIEVDSLDKGDFIYEITFYRAKRIAIKYQILADIVVSLTGIWVVLERGDASQIKGFGSKDQIEVADYLWDVLNYTIDKELAKRRKENPAAFYGTAGTNGFYFGVEEAIQERFSKREDEGEAMALVKYQSENQAKAKAIVYSEARVKTKNHGFKSTNESREQGKAYGANLNIGKGINKNQESKRITY